jgi:hypothetical protein
VNDPASGDCGTPRRSASRRRGGMRRRSPRCVPRCARRWTVPRYTSRAPSSTKPRHSPSMHSARRTAPPSIAAGLRFDGDRRHLKPRRASGWRSDHPSGLSGRVGCRCLASDTSCALSTQPIPVSQLRAGTYLCIQTGEGRLSQLRVREPVGLSPGEFLIRYVTFAAPAAPPFAGGRGALPRLRVTLSGWRSPRGGASTGSGGGPSLPPSSVPPPTPPTAPSGAARDLRATIRDMDANAAGGTPGTFPGVPVRTAR